MKNLTENLTSLKIGQETTIELSTMMAHKVIGMVNMLQSRHGMSYLVGGSEGRIIIENG